MKFGPADLDKAKGSILAHAMDLPDGRLKKGHVIGDEAITRLKKAGIASIVVASLEAGDVEENEASARIAEALASNHVATSEAFTGRVNLYAEKAGLFVVDEALVNQINRIDPAFSFATLPQHSAVEAGRMVATIKIIPFAVAGQVIDDVLALIGTATVLDLKPFRPRKVGLIATQLPSLKPAIMDKTRKALQVRLDASRSVIIEELRVEHEIEPVSEALDKLKNSCDLVILFGASAIADLDDVIPAALRKAGGVVEHFGMPVDPGNLLMQGHLGAIPVIGAPGCARSPAENGFDWVLQRLLADMPMDADAIEGLGVGGLLMEIHSRPQPRQAISGNDGKICAVILAAGQSRRMGRENKLLARLDGKPLLRHVTEAAAASGIEEICVVTGHEADRVQEALSGLDVHFAHNPDYDSGLGSSLRSGIAALSGDCAGAIILLGDMPRISAAMIDQQIEAFHKAPHDSIILATSHGKRGNPVLWPISCFEALKQISGDVGARHLIGQNADRVVEIELGEAAALDIDTPVALAAEGGDFAGE